MEYYLFSFNSTNDAIAAQKLLAKLDAIVMPTLREISASCGMSLRVSPNRIGEARNMMEHSAITGWNLHSVKQDGRRNVCTLILKK